MLHRNSNERYSGRFNVTYNHLPRTIYLIEKAQFQYKLQPVGVSRPDLLEPQRAPREQAVFVPGAAAAD